MISLISTARAQEMLAKSIRELRLSKGLTQAGLAERSGVSLPTLRKFEQKGRISLESFLKIAMVLDRLERLIKALEPSGKEYTSIQDVLRDERTKKPQRGWRT